MKSRRDRRGHAATVVGSIVPLLGVAALVVDIGNARVERAALQSATDAAAAAAAAHLDGQEGAVEAAVEAAYLVASANGISEDTLQTMTLAFGVWDEGQHRAAGDDETVDAVSISIADAPVDLFFARAAFGTDALSVSAKSIAKGPVPQGASEVECYMPLAVPACMVEQVDDSPWADVTLRLSSSNDDNVGWARLGGSPNASWLRTQIASCEGGSIVEDVGLQNGSVTSALKELADAIDESSTSWDTNHWGPLPEQMSNSSITEYGNTFEGPAIVFDAGGDCGASQQFNGTEPVVGFVWMVVYDAADKGSDKNIRARFDLERQHIVGTRGDGPDYGVMYPPPAATIVR